MNQPIIFLEATLKETIWGGQRLAEFGCRLPGSRVGECWAISAHPHGDNRVLNAEYGGLRLSQLWESRPELFGRAAGEPSAPFPLLTKIIDAQDDLSIQVHPDDAYAAAHENGSLGKTECWYVLDCAPGATIVIGHNARSREELERMITERRWKELIREVPVRKGDFFFITPGTMHAIKGGTLILETQQSSDVTYRVYDYDRLSGGKPRELHVRQSIDVITAPFVAREPPLNPAKTANREGLRQLVSCPQFTVWHADVDGGMSLVQDQPFMLVSVIAGEGTVDGTPVSAGTHCILPCGYGTARLEGRMELILSAT